MKYRDTYRIVTQVSRYVSHRDFRYRATPTHYEWTIGREVTGGIAVSRDRLGGERPLDAAHGRRLDARIVARSQLEQLLPAFQTCNAHGNKTWTTNIYSSQTARVLQFHL